MKKKIGFRTLNANEIDVKVGATNAKRAYGGSPAKPATKVMLLLYKDARVDMDLLDETIGAENWQTKYELIDGTLYCSIGIRSSALVDNKLLNDDWVWKQSNGVESQGTGEDDPNNKKGEASDALTYII